LKLPKEIAKGLKIKEEDYAPIDGSLIDEVCGSDNRVAKLNFYKKIGLCEDNLIIQPDFNFVTTLRLGVELQANQSVKLILKKIFDENKRVYQEAIMLDLPIVLDFELIERIFPFLERDHDEFMQIQDDQDNMHSKEETDKAQFCNFEDFILHPNLPPFASEPVNYHVMQSFIDYHNSE